MDSFDEEHPLRDCAEHHRRGQGLCAKYQQIAADLASKICAGKLCQGNRIYAKSSIASQYGVSNETARRALKVLEDYGIVEIRKGSGVRIVSKEAAMEFVRRHGSVLSFAELRIALETEISAQMQSRRRIEEILERLREKAQHFREENPFFPYSIHITPDCAQVGKTLLETHFWNNTSATVVAISRNGELLLSPGPDLRIEAEDILYYIGAADCVAKVREFLLPVG